MLKWLASTTHMMVSSSRRLVEYQNRIILTPTSAHSIINYCRCLLASWNLDQNLGETYEYVLEIADRPSRLGFPEGTLTSVCVYDHETIKLNTDHYFIEQYHRQRAPLKHLCRCVLLRPINWNLDQNLGRICNRRRYCS